MIFMTQQRILLLAVSLVFFPSAGKAEDTSTKGWPQFRGPNGSGVADESKPSAEWGADKNVQWKVAIPGAAWSSPIVWGDKVFVTTAVTDNQRKPSPGGGFGGFGGGLGGARGGFGGPPQPGLLLNPFLQEILQLKDEPKRQLQELQKGSDAKLAKILTDEQNKQLKEIREGGGRGPGGRGGFGGFPQPGQVMSPAIQDQLKLSADQKKQLSELQKEDDSKLAKILTEEQNKQLSDMRQMATRGPGGFGRGGGGRGGPGGFGGGRPPDVVYRWQVYCLDRASGEVLWKQIALEGKPRIPIQQSNTYASETPVTDGERVYAYFGMHGLFCYDFDGNLIWKKDLGSYPTVMGQGPASSPVLDGDRLFLQIDNEEKSFLVALDKKTGEEIWKISRSERTNHSSPVVWKNKLRTELVTNGSGKVRSYDPATGKIIWELSMGGGRCYSTPVGDSERLYVGSQAGFGMGGGRMPGGPGGDRGGDESGGPQGRGEPGGARGPSGRGGFGGGGGLFAIKAGATGDITPKKGETSNDDVAWSHSKGGPEMASPLVYQHHLYILHQNGGLVTCYDAKTGKQLYHERIPSAGSFWASPWASDGKIFCLDEGGTTHVLQAGSDFKVLGKNTLKGMFWATPAVAGGALILRDVDNLYCIKG
jgi:outer membrane protein assembly factor BamB